MLAPRRPSPEVAELPLSMAKRPKPRVRVRILLFEEAAIGLALVMRDALVPSRPGLG